MRAIFKNTEQAVWFSFTIQAFEPGRESQMAKVLRRHLEELGEAEGYRSSIDFDGLNALEVRGQAAMVRLAVEALLPGPESWAVKSRYGLTNIVRQADGSRSFAFSAERLIAMRGLAAYLAPDYERMSHDALMLLIARACGEAKAVRPALQQIEAEVGISKSALGRAGDKLKARVDELVGAGLDRLTPLFQREGIVPSEENAICS